MLLNHRQQHNALFKMIGMNFLNPLGSNDSLQRRGRRVCRLRRRSGSRGSFARRLHQQATDRLILGDILDLTQLMMLNQI